MKKFPVALQFYSVRDMAQEDFYGALKQVKELGYDGVEFAGLYGNDPEQIKKWCEELNLVPVSAHVPFVDMIANPDLLKDYKTIGCEYVAIPYLTEEYRPGAPKFNEVIEGAKMLGQKANELGMTLLYHNHDFEFAKVDGKYALDVLYDTVSADLLKTELDCCWVKVGGEDPADYIKKYAGRCPVVHLKDFVGSKTANMYELIGIEGKKAETKQKEFEFRPVGYGCQDFFSILNASEESGANWVVVEQDRPSMDLSSMDCAKLSVNYVKTLLNL